MDLSFFKNLRVLITGGAGFIGSNLCLRLVEAGSRVTVVDNLREGGGGNLHSLRSVEEKIRYLPFDLSRDFPQPELEADEFDLVFNLAGSLGHADSMRRPKDDLFHNVLVHLQLLQWLGRSKNSPKVIFTSTRQIYGVAANLPVAEDAVLSPVDINGANKICAEHYHQIFGRTFGFPVVILRLTNTYGQRMALKGNDLGVANAFFSSALKGETLKIFGSGNQIRDFSFIGDVVEALLLAAFSESAIGEIFNLSGEAVSLKQFSLELGKHFPDLRAVTIPFPSERKGIDIGDFVADDTKIKSQLGWHPKVSLSEGVKITADFFTENGRYYL